MNDLISRQALCEYALNQKDKSVTPNDIMRFPSAQSEPQWIPCSERLPEIGQYVICQCRAGIIDVLALDNDGIWFHDTEQEYYHDYVIAWMPLPKPYKEEE